MTTRERILEYISEDSGCTELQIAQALFGIEATQQRVNSYIRRLSAAGTVVRTPVKGVYRYSLPGSTAPTVQDVFPACNNLSEDAVKDIVCAWLQGLGYETYAAMGQERGIDILGKKDGRRWVIEAKGCGSRPQMRANYFLVILGQMLQRMDDENARYSIAVPDMLPYRRLWDRLPALAKKRTGITTIFVDESGNVTPSE